MTDLKARADALRELRAKATQEELRDQGRYFAETCDDLTRCRHGETGEYVNEHDGRYIEALWNSAPALLDELDRLRDALAASEAQVVKLREALEDAAEALSQEQLHDGDDPETCETCATYDRVRQALTAAQEKNDD